MSCYQFYLCDMLFNKNETSVKLPLRLDLASKLHWHKASCNNSLKRKGIKGKLEEIQRQVGLALVLQGKGWKAHPICLTRRRVEWPQKSSLPYSGAVHAKFGVAGNTARTFLTWFRTWNGQCPRRARENKTHIPRSTAEEDHIAAPGLKIHSGCNKRGSKHEFFPAFNYDPKLF